MASCSQRDRKIHRQPRSFAIKYFNGTLWASDVFESRSVPTIDLPPGKNAFHSHFFLSINILLRSAFEPRQTTPQPRLLQPRQSTSTVTFRRASTCRMHQRCEAELKSRVWLRCIADSLVCSLDLSFRRIKRLKIYIHAYYW